MSLVITKQGVFDTVQDTGRYGFQHWGINPGGAADDVSSAVANMLVGNMIREAVLELHYPAASIRFQQAALVALSGADFTPVINGRPIPLNTPVIVQKESVLEFNGLKGGYRCYLAIGGGIALGAWLHSYSTNTKAGAGGYKGRTLKTGDEIFFRQSNKYPGLDIEKSPVVLGWHAAPPVTHFKERKMLRVCEGHEHKLLCGASKEVLINTGFTITKDYDRMGCRLSGIPLQINMQNSLVSSGVTRGTIQLLPSGQLIILAADHQSTGGYPRIGHVISADMHILGQLRPGETVGFSMTDITAAEDAYIKQQQYLQQLEIGCTLQLENFFVDHAMH